MVSWASFTRYQELRQEASNFHKELLALKAKAVEIDSLVTIKYASSANACTVAVFVEDNSGNIILSKRPINLNKNVKLEFPTTGINAKNGDLEKLSVNEWASKKQIDIEPKNHLEEFNRGRVLILSTSDKVKKTFCIQKDSLGIKPELYYSSNGSGPWKKI
jgi:hypothetical protein